MQDRAFALVCDDLDILYHMLLLNWNANNPFNPILGQQFALVETSYVLVRLLQEYANIKANDNGAPWREHLTLTCSVGQGVWVNLVK